MTNYKLLLVLVLVNIFIVLIYFLIKCIKKQYKQGLLVGGLMMVTPIFGPILMFLSYVFSVILKVFNVGCFDASEITFNKDKNRVILADDIKRGINKVPMEEALLESDSENARRVLFDIIKADFQNSIPLLMDAINSEDSEVSHYASAVISDVLSKFKKNQKKYEEEYNENKDDVSLLDSYMEYVYRYLACGIFPEAEFDSYLKVYEELMQERWDRFQDTFDSVVLSNWVIFLVKENRKEMAKRWLDCMEYSNIDLLETYRARLQYSYKYNKRDFKNCIREIKSSSIELDEELIEFVRFFKFNKN